MSHTVEVYTDKGWQPVKDGTHPTVTEASLEADRLVLAGWEYAHVRVVVTPRPRLVRETP